LAGSSAAIDSTTSTVTATAWAVDAAGARGRDNLFAPVLGFDTTQVNASATAGCGHPLAGTAALPLTFDQCNFLSSTSPTIIGYNTTATRCTGKTGNVVPGNFGWLMGGGGGCPAQISTSVYQTPGSPGISIPEACKPILNQLNNTVALIPMYDMAGGSGSGGWFHIIGFAAFKITGYRFSGNPEFNWQNTGIAGQPSCTGDCRGIIGTFVNRVGLDEGFTMGGTDFGVTLVNLVK